MRVRLLIWGGFPRVIWNLTVGLHSNSTALYYTDLCLIGLHQMHSLLYKHCAKLQKLESTPDAVKYIVACPHLPPCPPLETAEFHQKKAASHLSSVSNLSSEYKSVHSAQTLEI